MQQADELGQRRDESDRSRKELHDTVQAFRRDASEVPLIERRKREAITLTVLGVQDLRKRVGGLVKRFQAEVWK